jgi:8-amino-7-oxononanoate synthase
MDSLESYAQTKLDALASRQLRRTLNETAPCGPVTVTRDGRRLISFCSNDYLNLSQHPALKRAAIEATERWGVGAGASRLVTGNHPLFAELERRLAALKGTEGACVFGSGYLANIGVIPTLVGARDLILADELSHACLLAGATLSKARVEIFRHNDLDHVAALLDEHRMAHERALLLTDGVFSMDGDLAPVGALSEIAKAHDAWLMTDDAHGIGVVGGGRGSSFMTGAKDPVPLQMGTLSKAVGSYGGYLCASQPVVDLIRTRARPFIYSTGLPPGVVAASIASLDLIASDPDLVATPLRKAALFCAQLNRPPPESCIVPIVIGAPERALAASELLQDEGYLVTAIRPPTVPEGTARLRLTFTAGHVDADIERLAAIVSDRVLAAA